MSTLIYVYIQDLGEQQKMPQQLT